MGVSQASWDFFIAHAYRDAGLAEQLYEVLRPRSRPFLDGRSLLLGDDWDLMLPRAQADSKVTVVLISQSTDKAYYQREEIANAIAMARKEESTHRVVPIYVDIDDADLRIPYGLRLKHGMKFSMVGGIDGVGEKFSIYLHA